MFMLLILLAFNYNSPLNSSFNFPLFFISIKSYYFIQKPVLKKTWTQIFILNSISKTFLSSLLKQLIGELLKTSSIIFSPAYCPLMSHQMRLYVYPICSLAKIKSFFNDILHLILPRYIIYFCKNGLSDLFLISYSNFDK